jgi:hypothetical protein
MKNDCQSLLIIGVMNNRSVEHKKLFLTLQKQASKQAI